MREKEARQEEGERAIFINFHVVYWSDKMERDENKRREERKRKD